MCLAGRYGYQLGGHGRWIAMHLKKPKNRGGGGKKRQGKSVGVIPSTQDHDDHGEEPGEDEETQASLGLCFPARSIPQLSS